jgi:hypothetical protein
MKSYTGIKTTVFLMDDSYPELQKIIAKLKGHNRKWSVNAFVNIAIKNFITATDVALSDEELEEHLNAYLKEKQCLRKQANESKKHE